MKGDSTIIVFPGAKDSRPTAARTITYTADSSVSQKISPIRAYRDAPPAAGLNELMIEQCDILVEGLRAFGEQVQSTAARVPGIPLLSWAGGDNLGNRLLETLETGASSRFDLRAVMQTAVLLNLAIDSARKSTHYVLELKIPTDGFMNELIAENSVCAQALRRGCLKMLTTPPLLASEAEAALRSWGRIEICYRRAQKNLEGQGQNGLTRLSDIETGMKRHEAYRHLHKIAKRLMWVGNGLLKMAQSSNTH